MQLSQKLTTGIQTAVLPMHYSVSPISKESLWLLPEPLYTAI